jgi:hypothetical protein
MTPRRNDTDPPDAPPETTRRRTATAPRPAQLLRVPADFVPRLRRFQRLLDRIDGLIDTIVWSVNGPPRPPGPTVVGNRPPKPAAPRATR